ncbi:Thymidylate synthase (EC 2.1.1.45) [Methylomonas albis]|uniref:Thymidylate synthase n=1 Tax=Methylomonas albis TaxID=1854563 RepID=A0ABR9D5T2_9GAMM|nr:thymidylate synthase [Methylomonas albis]MBD9358484.1 thymidylate synthase [Methylomonas albis]CAD6881896.1 Thymidylate synthase (EC 2.1.1.45) [Methylomonas albis]
MQPYLDLLADIMTNGIDKSDRTGTGTRSVFGRQMRYSLADGFPLLTTKKLHFKSIACELLWFLRGDTNIKYLNDHGVTIWNEWATPEGELGPVYGAQWRNWLGPNGERYDQMLILLDSLKNKPDSRRHIVSGWNVAFLPDETIGPRENAAAGRMALPPCHVLYQFYVANGKLSCMMTQRSADCFLGVPYNQASVALLTHMLAQQSDLEVGELIMSFGDVHIYRNHFEQVELQLSRQPWSAPQLKFRRRPESLFSYEFADFELLDYQAHRHIAGAVSV